ncbi:MAG: murein biosynthesis integral membrane protein MurJ [Alphaproteobacteria bacterium]|nr:murein biosynthesis integral membrane protein MurJ [Alphaproteobacteria bacterium]
MSLLRGAFTVGGWTLVSRILGFARDMVIARAIGTGWVADAWAVAFRFPNLFRRLLGEGALNSAFVPMYAKRLEGDGRGAADRLAEEIQSVMLPILFAISALAMLTMPWIMQVYAPGFAGDPAKFALATDMTKIAFPYLMFMSMVALYSGVLNTHGRFAAATAAQSLLNIGLLAAALVAQFALDPAPGDPIWGMALAYGCVVAGAMQFLYLMWMLARGGIRLRLHMPRLSPDARRMFVLMVPGIIAGGVSQISIFVSTIVASLEAGAPAILYFADRIYQFPLSIVGTAMGVVLLPTLARHLRSGREDLALYWQNRGIELAMLLTLPAAVALVIISTPISIALFEGGAFDRASSLAVGHVLVAFGVGLPAFILNKVLTPAFFAREDTATPMKFAVITLIIDLALAVGLFFAFGVIGIAIATAAAAWINCGLLASALRARGLFRADARTLSRIGRIVLASLVMGAALIGLLLVVGPWLDMGTTRKAAALAVLCLGGLAVYAAAAFALGATSLGELKEQFRRERAKPAADTA